ncbi:hypothetical protein G7048_23010 [Diaphorobacter sp. HDW4B]|uniref:hypothetical protein n=1 Tax=Diaphorobacter sp. HDW4B TaxID=2714925 RepID=UPI00140A98C4|nr:hypothetical protein [Diaphorobacter sp. HDW4B]QIL72965.1 hypothetical protein G7048_23010 [Diaphorobacter sp. HDW4B]
MQTFKKFFYSLALLLVALVSVLAAPNAMAQVLKVSQSWPDRPFAAGQVVNFSVTINNIGTVNAPNVRLINTTTAGIFSSVNWTCTSTSPTGQTYCNTFSATTASTTTPVVSILEPGTNIVFNGVATVVSPVAVPQNNNAYTNNIVRPE